MGAEEGEKFKDTTTYTYESFDEHGNWTARSAKAVTVEVGRKLVELNITNNYFLAIYFYFTHDALFMMRNGGISPVS